MNDEQFEYQMRMIEHAYNPTVVAALRARDTAQREALARVEADKDTATRVLARQIDKSAAVIAERDAAQAQLAEAVGLLRDIADWPNGGSQYGQEKIKSAAQGFLARHAQAEQQEARPALATQPAAGEPVAPKEVGEVIVTLRDGMKCFAFEEYSEAYKLPEGLHYLYPAPPAAAHGDELEKLLTVVAGFLFNYDDGVGKPWERRLLDYARKLVPAKEFSAQAGEGGDK